MAGFGAALARALPPLGEAPLLLYLSGDLGAGKTTLARGLLAQLGVKGAVRSPTYTLVEVHAPGALHVVHADLYRLDSAADLEPLGLRELHRPGHVWVVEWPERAGDALPAGDLHLELTIGRAAHLVRCRTGSDRGLRWYAEAVELARVSH